MSGPATTAPQAAQWTSEQITKRSGSNFLASFSSLEPERRSALTAIYAFCRVVDDAVDDCEDLERGRADLAYWNEELDRADRGEPRCDVGRAVHKAIHEIGVQRVYLQNVLEGVGGDLEQRAIQTDDELEQYCFLVACSVGLACLPVFGAAGPGAESYAKELGHALQLTNILRDLRQDARVDRYYAPSVWLDEAGVEPAWLLGDGPNEAYVPAGPVAVLARRLADAANCRFEAARVAIDAVGPDMRQKLLPAEIMSAVYHDLLGRLEKLGGEVCRARRARVPAWRKLLVARRVRREIVAGR